MIALTVKKSMFSSVLIALSLSACRDPSVQRTDSGTQSFSPTSPSIKSGDVTGDLQNVTVPAPTAPDFAAILATADAFEIKVSQLAVSNGASPAIKDFAQRMVADHQASTIRLQAALRRDGLKPPTPTLTAEQLQILKQLSAKRGSDFDSAYLTSQENAHLGTLATLKTYAKKGPGSALNQYAYDLITIVSGHLTMLRNIMRQNTTIRPG
ncbi:DUF4142 domain-containing protein [Sphingomonas sp. 3P27F8]|uniref:DUF4142 domain-containing protein n=1 Tax=Sphingomonas sp. 3P27F8 TaxID=2502213 RepID=UPI0010F5602D|nr:DUF4142 domain-containing protein [Sphingomonas sp. 3P27F8]